MAEREYVRLTRGRRRRGSFFEGFTTSSSLWLGKDHVLSVDSKRYSEQYKRFYFRDIQAITIIRTKRRDTWNLVLALFVVVSLAFMFEGFGTPAATWAVIFLIVISLNNYLGPTCRAYLRTAVQVEELPSLNRVNRAEKVLSRIRPLIVTAQGQLEPEEAAVRMRELFGSRSEPAQQSSVVTGPLNLSS